MSISLTGILFPTSLHHTVAYLNQVRPLLKQNQQAKLTAHTVLEAVIDIDRAHYHKTACPTPWKRAAQEALSQRNEIRTSKTRHPAVDTDFELALFLTGDQTLGMVMTETPHWTRVVMMDDAVDYSWYNGSDRPETISEKDWDTRERVWTSAMAPSWVPAETGVIWSVGTLVGRISTQNRLLYLPTSEDRARTLAKTVAIDAWAKTQMDTSNWSPSTLVSRLYSPDHLQEVERLTAQIQPTLLDITDTLLDKGF